MTYLLDNSTLIAWLLANHQYNSRISTDFHFCNLAHKHGMKWATLDKKCPHSAVELIP